MSHQELNDKLARLLGRTPSTSELQAVELGRKYGENGDCAIWVPTAKVIKYSGEHIAALKKQYYKGVPDHFELQGHHLRYLEAEHGVQPDEVVESVGNLLTTAGLNRLTNLFIGGGAAASTNAQTFLGVGDSTTAATVGDTALGAATNKYYQAADATYPTQSNGLLTCNVTYASGSANYVWNEWVWGIATGTLTAGTSLPGTSPIILNHKIQSMGTKVSTAVWTLQATVTIA